VGSSWKGTEYEEPVTGGKVDGLTMQKKPHSVVIAGRYQTRKGLFKNKSVG